MTRQKQLEARQYSSNMLTVCLAFRIESVLIDERVLRKLETESEEPE